MGVIEMTVSNGMGDNVLIDFSCVKSIEIDSVNLNVVFIIDDDNYILVHRKNLEGVFSVIDRVVNYNGDSLPVRYI